MKYFAARVWVICAGLALVTAPGGGCAKLKKDATASAAEQEAPARSASATARERRLRLGDELNASSAPNSAPVPTAPGSSVMSPTPTPKPKPAPQPDHGVAPPAPGPMPASEPVAAAVVAMDGTIATGSSAGLGVTGSGAGSGGAAGFGDMGRMGHGAKAGKRDKAERRRARRKEKRVRTAKKRKRKRKPKPKAKYFTADKKMAFESTPKSVSAPRGAPAAADPNQPMEVATESAGPATVAVRGKLGNLKGESEEEGERGQKFAGNQPTLLNESDDRGKGGRKVDLLLADISEEEVDEVDDVDGGEQEKTGRGKDAWKASTGERLSQVLRGGLDSEEDRTKALEPEDSAQIDLPRAADALEAVRWTKPGEFLPRMFYFDPTYLGGNAAARERQRRLRKALPASPFGEARVYQQDFDAPSDAGMALSVRLDRNHVDRPGRVYLEVGLQGSRRFGWRRPPLDMIVVADGAAWNGHRDKVEQALERLLKRLGPQDRLGLVVAGLARPVVQSPARLRELRRGLSRQLESAGRSRASGGSWVLTQAMALAAKRLADVSEAGASIPGTRTVLLLTASGDSGAAAAAKAAAHRMTSEQAVFTSVVELTASPAQAKWWDVAATGYGNYHRLAGSNLAAVVDAELSSLSRVVARLLRLNVRLGPHTRAIRVVGTRKLTAKEVKEVKAREVAIDVQLSKSQGVKADRGEDDDGVQTVIPYFYGGDSHVVVLELWVDKPGPVADVTLKYKDMVKLGNATARASVAIGSTPRETTPDQRAVAKNLRGARIAEHLKVAGQHVRRGSLGDARHELQQAAALVPHSEIGEAGMVRSFQALVNRAGQPRLRDQVAEALTLAGQRKLGISGN